MKNMMCYWMQLDEHGETRIGRAEIQMLVGDEIDQQKHMAEIEGLDQPIMVLGYEEVK